jgi:hypothetical protein
LRTLPDTPFETSSIFGAGVGKPLTAPRIERSSASVVRAHSRY